jgi:hypothetical protein
VRSTSLPLEALAWATVSLMSWLSRTRSLQCFFAEHSVFNSVYFFLSLLGLVLSSLPVFLLLSLALGSGVLISVGAFCYVRRITTDTRTTRHSVFFLGFPCVSRLGCRWGKGKLCKSTLGTMQVALTWWHWFFLDTSYLLLMQAVCHYYSICLWVHLKRPLCCLRY